MWDEGSDLWDRPKLPTPFYLPSSDLRAKEGDFAPYSHGPLPRAPKAAKDGEKQVKGEKKRVKKGLPAARENREQSWPEDDHFRQQQDPFQHQQDPLQQYQQQRDTFQQQQDPFQQRRNPYFTNDPSLWRRTSLPNRPVGQWEIHNVPTSPPLPPLLPSLLRCPSDLGDADEIELSPSRASYADPVGGSTISNGMRVGDFGYDQDPNDILGYEDDEEYGDIPVMAAKSRHGGDHYTQDPNESCIWEDDLQYHKVLPMKLGKTRKVRPRKPLSGQESYRPVIDHYEQVQRLVECMPHLKQLQIYSSRNPSGGSITRLEYGKHIELPRQKSRKTFDSKTWSGSASKFLAKKLGPKRGAPCCLRVLLVEDLSKDLMRALGFQYQVDPEAFAAHIATSGHDKLSYTDLSESRWSTVKTKKSYRSIKWFRPVRLGSRVLSWLQNPEDLTKLEGQGIEWTETSYERRGNVLFEKKTKHHVRLNTNTFRQTRPLSTRPLDF